jgi:hypothetical protein
MREMSTEEPINGTRKFTPALLVEIILWLTSIGVFALGASLSVRDVVTLARILPGEWLLFALQLIWFFGAIGAWTMIVKRVGRGDHQSSIRAREHSISIAFFCLWISVLLFASALVLWFLGFVFSAQGY